MVDPLPQDFIKWVVLSYHSQRDPNNMGKMKCGATTDQSCFMTQNIQENNAHYWPVTFETSDEILAWAQKMWPSYDWELIEDRWTERAESQPLVEYSSMARFTALEFE